MVPLRPDTGDGMTGAQGADHGLGLIGPGDAQHHRPPDWALCKRFSRWADRSCDLRLGGQCTILIGRRLGLPPALPQDQAKQQTGSRGHQSGHPLPAPGQPAALTCRPHQAQGPLKAQLLDIDPTSLLITVEGRLKRTPTRLIQNPIKMILDQGPQAIGITGRRIHTI